MRLSVYGDTVAAMVTAAVLADTGNEVWLVLPEDVERAQMAARAQLEPGLAALLDGPTLHWAETQAAREQAWRQDVHFFVMSPEREVWAFETAAAMGKAASGACVLVNRATFTVGTSERLKATVEQAGRGCHLVVEPDFMTEGRAIQDFMRPDRILLGTDDAVAESVMRELYRPFNRNRDVIQRLSPRAAELTKFATNAMLATRISFINELAQLAEAFEVDVEQVRQALGSDHRIGFDFLYPGIGFGGPNFARDVQRMAEMMRQHRVDGTMLQAVLRVNDQQKEALFRKAWRHFDRDLRGRRFTFWGVSYKPGTASVVNAPSIVLARALLAQGAEVCIHDHPAVMEQFRERVGPRYQSVQTETDMYAAARESDGVMLLTEWKHYWHPDWMRLHDLMRTPVLFDGRNIYDPDTVRQAGFAYYGIGR